MLLVVIFAWFLSSAQGDEAACKVPTPSLKLSGVAKITAILDGHSGTNCTIPVHNGRQQMAALAWVVNTINHVQILPGVKIGVSLYDGCTSYDTTEKALLSALVSDLCSDKYSLGVITTPRIFSTLKPLSDTLHLPVSLTYDPVFTTHLYDVITHLLLAHNWTTVDLVITWSRYEYDRFSLAARDGGVCVLGSKILEDQDGGNVEDVDGVIVMFGSMDMIAKMIRSPLNNAMHTQWVIIPDDTEDTLPTDIPDTSILVMSNPVVLRQPHADPAQTDPWASVDRQIFLDVASAVYDVLLRLKLGLETNCSTNESAKICPELTPFQDLLRLNSTSADNSKTIPDLFEALQIDESSDNSIFYIVNRIKPFGNGTKQLEKTGLYQLLNNDEAPNAIFKYTDLGFKNDTLTNPNFTVPCLKNRHNTYDVHCLRCINFQQYYKQEVSFSEEFLFAKVSFREDGWVAALVSISALGVLCSLAVAIFIIVRSCKGDVLEGNPTFSFLLLLAIILTYASIIPFSVQIVNTGFLCSLRILATCISYAILFSVMLARSLMLASCDNEGGFMSHVNGYLQAVLCFFMFAVQVALSVQLWVVTTHFLPKEQCSFYKGYSFLIVLTYDAFLLLILLCSTPFITQSKRNYREGVFFTSAAIVCTLIWTMWVVGYVLAPKWRDMMIASGLTGTATAVLVSVFIPRTYLMMSSITRDNIANALPAMAYNNTSILDLNYRTSTQALYATVNPPLETRQHLGQSNPNFYSGETDVNDLESNSRTVPSTAKLNSCAFGSRRSPTPENTYERYTPPSPLKVTRF